MARDKKLQALNAGLKKGDKDWVDGVGQISGLTLASDCSALLRRPNMGMLQELDKSKTTYIFEILDSQFNLAAFML